MPPKKLIVEILRNNGYKYKDRSYRREYYKRPGSSRRIPVPLTKLIDEQEATAILRLAGIPNDEITRLLGAPDEDRPKKPS